MSSRQTEWFRTLVGLEFGKRVQSSHYVHCDGVPALPEEVRTAVASAAAKAGVQAGDYDVIKMAADGSSIAFLAYPTFFTAGFPVLVRSWTVTCSTGRCTKRDYPPESNPPVLHRKELLLPIGHVRQQELCDLTRAAEQAGLFEDVGGIGRLVQWNETLRTKGLRVEGHQLVRSEGDVLEDQSVEQVLRHRTALRRNALSTPMQALLRYGFLIEQHSVFDYGCGRGDDVTELRARGLNARGWDPHFAPNEQKVPADVVNLGFVLNVIEDATERREALVSAFGLAQKVLAVAVLIGGRTAYERYRLFKDGVLTSRGTFQKYFSQEELREYLASTLQREPVAVAPGISLVFKSDDDEQAFLADRQRLARQWCFVSARHNAPHERPEPVRASRTPRSSKWEQHREHLDAFWARSLELGRPPDEEEMSGFEMLATFGRPPTILRKLTAEKGQQTWERARQERVDDVRLYLALNLFERRKSFATLPARLQRDVKAFLGSYSHGLAESKALLFSAGDTALIRNACDTAASQSTGYIDDDGNLQLHSSLVPRLPVVLRVYIGCAARLYGGVENADVVKIHVGSGKLTLTLYDDFEGKALPELIERVKIDMRKQEILFYEYGTPPFDRQLLYLKSRLMSADMDGFQTQASFDAELTALGAFSFAGFGPPAEYFNTELERRGLRIEGFTLVQDRDVPRAEP